MGAGDSKQYVLWCARQRQRPNRANLQRACALNFTFSQSSMRARVRAHTQSRKTATTIAEHVAHAIPQNQTLYRHSRQHLVDPQPCVGSIHTHTQTQTPVRIVPHGSRTHSRVYSPVAAADEDGRQRWRRRR